jgi:hypothetical protein
MADCKAYLERLIRLDKKSLKNDCQLMVVNFAGTEDCDWEIAKRKSAAASAFARYIQEMAATMNPSVKKE